MWETHLQTFHEHPSGSHKKLIFFTSYPSLRGASRQNRPNIILTFSIYNRISIKYSKTLTLLVWQNSKIQVVKFLQSIRRKPVPAIKNFPTAKLLGKILPNKQGLDFEMSFGVELVSNRVYWVGPRSYALHRLVQAQVSVDPPGPNPFTS